MSRNSSRNLNRQPIQLIESNRNNVNHLQKADTFVVVGRNSHIQVKVKLYIIFRRKKYVII